MTFWEVELIRKAALSVLAEFVPNNYYDGLSTGIDDQLKKSRLDNELGRKLCFFDPNPKITAQQFSAADVLMWVGFYEGTDTILSLPAFETMNKNLPQSASQDVIDKLRDIETAYYGLLGNLKSLNTSLCEAVCFYAMYLPDCESKALLKAIEKKDPRYDFQSEKDNEAIVSEMAVNDAHKQYNRVLKTQGRNDDFISRAKKIRESNPNLSKTKIAEMIADEYSKETGETLDPNTIKKEFQKHIT